MLEAQTFGESEQQLEESDEEFIYQEARSSQDEGLIIDFNTQNFVHSVINL